MMISQFRLCDCKIYEWLNFGKQNQITVHCENLCMIFMQCGIHRGDSQTNHFISQYYAHISLGTEYDISINLPCGETKVIWIYICVIML